MEDEPLKPSTAGGDTDGMSASASMSVEHFRRDLEGSVREICKERDWRFDNDAERGWAFQFWIAELFRDRDQGIDTEPEDAVLLTRDKGFDIILEDPNEKAIYLVQTKYVSLAARPPITIDEAKAFFSKHELLLDTAYVKKHVPPAVRDRIGNYADLIKQNYHIYFYFLTTGRDDKQEGRDLADHFTSRFESQDGATFYFLDFYGLKEMFVEARTLEQSIPDSVEFTLARNKWFLINQPRHTLVASVSANTLVNMYRKERERLFAYNIRSFLGRKGINKDIIETAEEDPDDFFYFNNGVSAICTHLDIDQATGRIVAKKFQIINGAQTVGALAQAQLAGGCEVLLRVTEGESVVTEKGFNADVIRYNNTQNIVKASDFRSNDEIQLWLEEQFRNLRPYGAVPAITYQRKRSARRARRGSYALKFEDLAKIRYAYLEEPTRCVADPRSLWTYREDGGVYEVAFGVDGQLWTIWPDEVWRDCLVAIVFYRAIEEKIDFIKSQEPDFVFMRRLRYFALSLVPLFLNMLGLDGKTIIQDNKHLMELFEDFWSEVSRQLIDIHTQVVEEEDGTLFALARSDTRWKALKSRFEKQIKLGKIAKIAKGVGDAPAGRGVPA